MTPIVARKYVVPGFTDALLMRAYVFPSDGISNGIINLRQVFNWEVGVEISYGIAYLTQRHLELIEQCVHDVGYLDNKLRHGFERIFSIDPKIAGTLIRRTLNLVSGENKFIERLIELLAEKPELCRMTTILYRVDGLNGGNRIVINELNANPNGAFRLFEISKRLSPRQDTLNIRKISDSFRKRIRFYTSRDSAYYYPVRTLRGPSSYSEKMILRHMIDDLEIDFFLGSPEDLEYTNGGVFITWNNKKHQIAYVAGLSSPEVFMKAPHILEHVKDSSVYCPSVIDNILGLSNKGTFCLVTDMREGRVDPALLGLTQADLNDENSPIPNTYWLYDCAKSLDNTSLFLKRNMVAKPIDGIGGQGVLFAKDIDAVLALNPTKRKIYLIQDFYPSFEIDAETMMQGSLDPYYLNDGRHITMTGALIRSAPPLPGTLPNLKANCTSTKHCSNYLYSIGVGL